MNDERENDKKIADTLPSATKEPESFMARYRRKLIEERGFTQIGATLWPPGRRPKP